MIDKNDYFETSEDDFTEQKEEEISLEDERTGTIKNSKIKIEEFFDKKKVAILVCIISALIFASIYFANQAKKNEKPKEQGKKESMSTGTGLDIKDAVNAQNQNTQTPEGVTQDGVANINTTTDGTGTPNLSQYDSQLGSEYNNDNLDSNYGSSSSSFSDISEDKNSNNSTVSEEKSKEWRKSAIGFDKGVSTQTPQTPEQYQEQQQVPQNVQQQNENDTDQNKQKSKSLFLKQKQDNFYSTNLKNPAIGKYELKTGSFIPAVLVTAINSDLPGDVIAQVRENVYDYRTGKYILIPMGTKIVGKYDSSITYGQNRVLLIWQRLVFPNGSTLVLDNMQGVDLLGNAGLKGKTNNHFWKLMRSVLLSSAINMASGSLESLDVNIEAGSRSRVNIGTGASDAAQNIRSIGERMVEKDLNRQPTIEIKRGKKFNIFVSKDIILSPYRK